MSDIQANQSVGDAPNPAMSTKTEEVVDKGFQVGFVDDVGTFVLEVKLHKVHVLTALGLLVQAQDIIKSWYADVAQERAKRRAALSQTSLGRVAREQLAKVGKLFIPRS